MRSIQEDLRNQTWKQFYLLYGEEVYLKKRYRDQLWEALAGKDDNMNVSRFEGKGINVGEIIDLAETLPFFAERRLIVIENSGFFKGSQPQLAEYLLEVPETTFFIFVEEEVDKRGKCFKLIKEKGRAEEFPRQDEKTLMNWILQLLKAENKKITRETMECFLALTGNDMSLIKNELEKLFSYTLGKDVIEKQDVEQICTVQISNQIFDMVRAVTEQNQKKALDLYYDLLALKEPPMRILFLLARQFNILLQIKNMAEYGMGQQQIAEKVKIPGFAVRNHIASARRFTSEQLKQAVESCVSLEESVKTGKMNDIMSVELFLIQYSSV